MNDRHRAGGRIEFTVATTVSPVVAGSRAPSKDCNLDSVTGRKRRRSLCLPSAPKITIGFLSAFINWVIESLLPRFRKHTTTTMHARRHSSKKTRAGTLDVKGLSRILRRYKLFENNKLKGSPLPKHEKAKEEKNYLNYFCCFSRPLSLTLNLSHLSLQKLPFPPRTFATSSFLFSSFSDGIHPFIQLLLWVSLRKREREREVPVAIVE